MSSAGTTSKIIFENENLVIIHKVAGVLSVRSRFHSTQPESTVLDQLGEFVPIHRLDREVEGLLLAAKTKKAHSICNAWFEKKEIKKSYWALTTKVDLSELPKLPFEVEDLSPQVGEDFVWKSKILRGKKRSYSSPHGDATETHSKLIGVSKTKSDRNIFQWELNPITGKSHQLRFEMAKHSHPILGDELYFAATSPKYPSGVALIARKLDFSQCAHRNDMGLPETVELNFKWESFVARLD